ncbi:DUF3644 domain-containing protein [Mycobacterium riyadhense]|uniref:DUF3644 domain-containing protein n=1 Tax=Mycobacterium riyadhense TaxID=486698 RepID=A0A653EQG4_9MYCO|nr:DUF3644 domain-containing protein [Mycobacterium riyadhense]VTO99005.1 hypothetical protein BIN_B_02794 [Mycobacterium riyadhense]
MNYRGSYRKLQGNAVSAILAAIEIYNKPRFPYRDEVFVVLLINAWELLLKAIVSKSGSSIYYPKRRREPYRTLTLSDAFKAASASTLWPHGIKPEPIRKNLDLLALYRDKTVHFYNEDGFGVLIYSLAQTSINNYRDISRAIFGRDVADEISWQILPLGAKSPVDPITYLNKGGVSGGRRPGRAVQEFLLEIQGTQQEMKGGDLSRVLTLYSVNLQSTKKLSDADVVVGVSSVNDENPTIVQRKIDPNKSHPIRQKDVLPLLREDLGIGSYEFQAITRIRGLRDDPVYCWKDSDISLVKWSPEVVQFINKLTPEDVKSARERYSRQTGKKVAHENQRKRGGQPPKRRPW